mmetsp:Transcript_52484/g.122057  ORF Transcript_52484/g.122057 Transcript_52484/m.122057 type:complete len:383 (+) Transcript_52484:57-1205(+)
MSQNRLDELYKLLQVPRNADEAAIKKSYRRLVLKYHPDKNPEDPEAAQEKIRAINAAYETLGNIAKRAAFETQALAVATVRGPRGVRMEYSTVAHRRSDVRLPKAFMLSPMGQPDKFLRCVDRSLVFHSREDVKSVGFDDFFTAARFSMSWLPELNNPDRLPKFNCLCLLAMQPSIVTGVGPNASGNAGWMSFGLSAGVTSSDVMLTSVSNDMCSHVFLQPSSDFPGAFRFEAAYFPGHFLAFDPPTLAQMTKVVDRFSVVDFVVTDFSHRSQFQTLDEVLIPAVKAIGGDKAHVKLTAVCADANVRMYFQMAMGNRVWDFSDFEIYFHAHWETWDYDPGQQTLRLRSSEDLQKLRAKRVRVTEGVAEGDAKRAKAPAEEAK